MRMLNTPLSQVHDSKVLEETPWVDVTEQEVKFESSLVKVHLLPDHSPRPCRRFRMYRLMC
jgi:hypothetical protein